MQGTWTPFVQFTGTMYGKLEADGCWQNWQAMSATMCKYHGLFARFGTTDPRSQPTFTPAEALVVSHVLGGGVWEQADWAGQLVSELHASEIVAPAAWSPSDLVWDELTPEALSEVEGGPILPRPDAHEAPPYEGPADVDPSQLHRALFYDDRRAQTYEGHPDRCNGTRAETCAHRDFRELVGQVPADWDSIQGVTKNAL